MCVRYSKQKGHTEAQNWHGDGSHRYRERGRASESKRGESEFKFNSTDSP